MVIQNYFCPNLTFLNLKGNLFRNVTRVLEKHRNKLFESCSPTVRYNLFVYPAVHSCHAELVEASYYQKIYSSFLGMTKRANKKYFHCHWVYLTKVISLGNNPNTAQNHIYANPNLPFPNLWFHI